MSKELDGENSAPHFIHHYASYSDTTSCDSNRCNSYRLRNRNYVVKVRYNNTTVFSVDLGEESTEIDVDEVVFLVLMAKKQFHKMYKIIVFYPKNRYAQIYKLCSQYQYLLIISIYTNLLDLLFRMVFLVSNKLNPFDSDNGII